MSALAMSWLKKKELKQIVLEKSPNATCFKCAHLFDRYRGAARPINEEMVWFCPQHIPAWDYATDVQVPYIPQQQSMPHPWAGYQQLAATTIERFYMKKQAPVRVNEDGTPFKEKK